MGDPTGLLPKSLVLWKVHVLHGVNHSRTLADVGATDPGRRGSWSLFFGGLAVPIAHEEEVIRVDSKLLEIHLSHFQDVSADYRRNLDWWFCRSFSNDSNGGICWQLRTMPCKLELKHYSSLHPICFLFGSLSMQTQAFLVSTFCLIDHIMHHPDVCVQNKLIPPLTRWKISSFLSSFT